MKNISAFHSPSLPTYLCFFYHWTLLKFNCKLGEQEESKDSLPFYLVFFLSRSQKCSLFSPAVLENFLLSHLDCSLQWGLVIIKMRTCLKFKNPLCLCTRPVIWGYYLALHTRIDTNKHIHYISYKLTAGHCSFPPLRISTITILVACQALDASAEMEMRFLCGK